MNNGSETWKWGIVFVLLAIFLITASNTYKHVTSQETFAPPDDYLKGDSWDLEHRSGPGAGQPMELAPEPQNTAPRVEDEEVVEPTIIQDDTDWSQIKDPTEN